MGNGTCFEFNDGSGPYVDLAFQAGSGPYVDLVPDEGALVTFTLPDPKARGWINGELHLEWTVKPPTQPQREQPFQLVRERLFPLVVKQPERRDLEVEDNRLAEAMKKMAPAQRSEFLRNPPRERNTIVKAPQRLTLSRSALLESRRVARSTTASVTPVKLDPATEQRRSKRVEELRRIFGKDIPHDPELEPIPGPDRKAP
jgi:hypothetical protein